MRKRNSRIGVIGFTAVLCLWVACAPLGKPSYVSKWEKTPDKNRWEVIEIDPKNLSPDEKALFDEQGMPKFVIHFWSAPKKKAVYQWVYENPLRFYRFVERKRADDMSVRGYDPWWR
ncbi:MAG: hypothetical protein JRG73_05930 [Deltaproteobacteria bacterium]|nr:hypothetical protein [Deltaproteobacteria bacterium]MBW2306461.1 hypothetical protein [Deltaproteobacteria bacterium]